MMETDSLGLTHLAAADLGHLLCNGLLTLPVLLHRLEK